MPNTMSRISESVSELTDTLLALQYSARIRSVRWLSTSFHSSSVNEGQMWCGCVIVFAVGFMMADACTGLMRKARRISTRREKAV